MFTLLKTREYQKGVKGQSIKPHLIAKMEERLQNPFKSQNVTPLQGKPNLYRYRLGAYRCIFEVDEAAERVTLLTFGPRGDIYKS